jgi:hypothetical protein
VDVRRFAACWSNHREAQSRTLVERAAAGSCQTPRRWSTSACSKNRDASVFVAKVRSAVILLPPGLQYRACQRPDGSLRSAPNLRCDVTADPDKEGARACDPSEASAYLPNPHHHQGAAENGHPGRPSEMCGWRASERVIRC